MALFKFYQIPELYLGFHKVIPNLKINTSVKI